MTTATAQKVDYAALPFLVETLLRIEKMRVSAQVRSSHLKREGRKCEETEAVHAGLDEMESYLTGRVAGAIEAHPAYPWFSEVKGIGHENIAKVVGLVRVGPECGPDGEDLPYASTISGLWQFAGYGKEKDGETQRRRKGKKLSYCSELRVMCYRVGESLMRARGKYYDHYLQEKAKYEARFAAEGRQIVPAADLPKVDGKKTETAEFISEGHIHNMALRKMIKLFLAHLWLEWRKGAGLPISGPYVQDKLCHEHIIDPWEMAG